MPAKGGDLWDYHGSGLLLPRGSVVVSTATDDELVQLAEDSQRRGVREWELARTKVRRSAQESLALDEFCSWLNRYRFDGFFSVTFSDVYARSHGIRDVAAAVRDVRLGFAEFGFRGRLGLGAEMTDREGVPHIHGVFASTREMTLEWLTSPEAPREGALWRYFFATRGRSRFEPMRDQNDATLYALKDTFKQSSSPNALYLRLRPLSGYRNSREHLTEQQEVFGTRRRKRIRARAEVD